MRCTVIGVIPRERDFSSKESIIATPLLGCGDRGTESPTLVSWEFFEEIRTSIHDPAILEDEAIGRRTSVGVGSGYWSS